MSSCCIWMRNPTFNSYYIVFIKCMLEIVCFYHLDIIIFWWFDLILFGWIKNLAYVDMFAFFCYTGFVKMITVSLALWSIYLFKDFFSFLLSSIHISLYLLVFFIDILFLPFLNWDMMKLLSITSHQFHMFSTCDFAYIFIWFLFFVFVIEICSISWFIILLMICFAWGFNFFCRMKIVLFIHIWKMN
jgi:hypothetical protein